MIPNQRVLLDVTVWSRGGKKEKGRGSGRSEKEGAPPPTGMDKGGRGYRTPIVFLKQKAYMKDWKGGTASTFKTIGASNHCSHDRQSEDYYATEPLATEWLTKLETFSPCILEPSCGEGHISEQLKKAGYEVTSRDLVDRGYGEVADFLSIDNVFWDGDIVTNPPYKYAQEFVEKALSIIPEGHKVAMFLKLTFLEGKGRKELFRAAPPCRVWVSSSRLKCAMNGDFDAIGGSATAYAWFIWEKGYKVDTIIKWFN